jgi:hypothetical protein
MFCPLDVEIDLDGLKDEIKPSRVRDNININDNIRINDNINILELKNTICALRKTIEDLEIRLKKYTNGDNHKRYYEKNKTKIKESGSLYLQKLKEEHPEKLKEYSRAAYQKKKNKKQLEEADADAVGDVGVIGVM